MYHEYDCMHIMLLNYTYIAYANFMEKRLVIASYFNIARSGLNEHVKCEISSLFYLYIYTYILCPILEFLVLASIPHLLDKQTNVSYAESIPILCSFRHTLETSEPHYIIPTKFINIRYIKLSFS